MVKIKIINGIYGYRPEGRMIVVPTSPKDPPIGVDEAEAERLVAAGIAQYVDASFDHHHHTHEEAVATGLSQPDGGETIANMGEDGDGESGVSEPDSVTGHLDAEDLKTWKYDDLKKLASDMGIEPGKFRKKEALIEAICAEEVTAPAEAIVPEVEDVVE